MKLAQIIGLVLLSVSLAFYVTLPLFYPIRASGALFIVLFGVILLFIEEIDGESLGNVCGLLVAFSGLALILGTITAFSSLSILWEILLHVSQASFGVLIAWEVWKVRFDFVRWIRTVVGSKA